MHLLYEQNLQNPFHDMILFILSTEQQQFLSGMKVKW